MFFFIDPFLEGHRIRIEVSSSNFPRFDRNLNNGGALGVDARIMVANQTVYHHSRYPSHIELPVIPQ
ncbi:CocE/NonD family hydrolase C-terminal non-catalytic domain-containing protein [Candidatus Palauibacter sp.]|uniref:CocE/NonD family hydrolase C-terminal non-catalytic domain-containing protein n=1 Tax=Candidatus Palauibacter sp. TaxID=3101350 RepID=UPI003C6EA4B2